MPSSPTYHFIRNATARLTYNGKTFLLDPMLSDKGALPSFAGIAPNPTVELPLAAEDIVADVDVVIVSHMHGDHFDDAAAALLDKSAFIVTPRNAAPPNPTEPSVTMPFKQSLESKGFTNVHEIGAGNATDHITLEGVTIHQVFGRHGKGKIGEMMGGVNGLVFEADGQPTIYWAGDTILDEDGQIEEILTRFKPDVVIAHTGGPLIEALSPEILLMDAAQAVTFFRHAVGSNPDVRIVAIHMDALDHCLSTRDSLVSAIDGLDPDLFNHVEIPGNGEQIVFG